MSCKSAIYTGTNSPATLATGAIIPIGTTIRRYGCSIQQNGNGINIEGAGYYEAIVSVTAAPTAAGTVSVALYNNGVSVPYASGSASVTTAGNPVNISFPAIIRQHCANAGALTLVLTGGATVTNVSMTVKKL